MKEITAYNCVIQILRTANSLWKESRRFFRQFGVTEAQFNVLHLLGQCPGGMSQRELSNLLVVDSSNVTLLLDRMQKRKWIVKNEVQEDRRVYCVSLSPSGKALWKKALPCYERVVEGLVKDASQHDLEKAHQFLQLVETRSKQWSFSEMPSLGSLQNGSH